MVFSFELRANAWVRYVNFRVKPISQRDNHRAISWNISMARVTTAILSFTPKPHRLNYD